MNSQQQINKITKSDICQKKFFENPESNITMSSRHFQQLKRSRSQKRFRVVAFLIRNIC